MKQNVQLQVQQLQPHETAAHHIHYSVIAETKSNRLAKATHN